MGIDRRRYSYLFDRSIRAMGEEGYREEDERQVTSAQAWCQLEVSALFLGIEMRFAIPQGYEYIIWPEMSYPNPGQYSRQNGFDVYMNPNWGIRHTDYKARALIEHMASILGSPDFWDQGMLPSLLWGHRDTHSIWRPSYKVNLSGTSGKLYHNFWLPWRSKEFQSSGAPYACNILDHEINLNAELIGLHSYAVRFGFSLEHCRCSICDTISTGKSLLKVLSKCDETNKV